MVTETCDWRKILRAYMRQVQQAEGITYLSVPFGGGAVETDLNEIERAALHTLEKEIANDRNLR